jgi:hypothetical protein
MATRLNLIALALSAALSMPIRLAGQEPYVRLGDRIVLYGHSDPAGRGFADLVETFLLTRFAKQEISFFRATAGEEFDSSSAAGRPTLIVVTADDAASAGFRSFLERAGSSSPPPRLTVLEDDGRPGASAFAAGQAADRILRLDVSRALAAAVERARAIDPALAHAMAVSGTPSRSLLIAGAVLEAWRAPALVSAVEIDALRGTAARVENTTVRDMENGRVVAWTQDDEALPLAVDLMDPSVTLAIQASDFSRRLDSQILRVRGMASERYRFTIDGELIGVFHRDQLDAGLNLALLRTPMWKRAMAVLALTRRHEELRASRRRLLEASAGERQTPDWRAALEALDADEAALLEEQLEKVKAGTHDYELQPVER